MTSLFAITKFRVKAVKVPHAQVMGRQLTCKSRRKSYRTDNCVLIVLFPSEFTFSQRDSCSQKRRAIPLFSLLVFIADQRKGKPVSVSTGDSGLGLALGSRQLPRKWMSVTAPVVSMVPN